VIKKFHENGQCPLDTYSHSQPNINCKLAKRSKNINDYLTPIIYTRNSTLPTLWSRHLKFIQIVTFFGTFFATIYTTRLYLSLASGLFQRKPEKLRAKIENFDSECKYQLELPKITVSNPNFIM